MDNNDARRSAGWPEQTWWNQQRASSMSFERYAPQGHVVPTAVPRQWPARSLSSAPLWCSVDLRDGNQALPEPMDADRKMRMFELLVSIGFKEVEIGYPSASEADFAFVRRLIVTNSIPNDVVVSVFTPARPELIDRTFEAIDGLDRGIVHLCNATACLWRNVVFGQTRAGVQRMSAKSAQRIAAIASRMPGSDLRFEYSPETFNVTEPEFALEVCDTVMDIWEASPERPVTINLPSTVETDTPNVYADQVEWMANNLARRDAAILSVHPHNDRGTAVASAELALMAGADRVEGTLFGNGERTGNVCLATLALNLFSHGIDPQLDFSDIDGVKRVVEDCNRIPVHARHPYAGDLVYTAFSGTHQDGIAKGLARLSRTAAEQGGGTRSLPWQVPYLPVDPHDVGRSYESVVRINSQSGKAGIAEALREAYGLVLPRGMRIEFAEHVQRFMDENRCAVTSQELWRMLQDLYCPSPSVVTFKPDGTAPAGEVSGILTAGSMTSPFRAPSAEAVGPTLVEALLACGLPDVIHRSTATQVLDGPVQAAVAIAEASRFDRTMFGFGSAATVELAAVRALLAVVERLTADTVVHT